MKSFEESMKMSIKKIQDIFIKIRNKVNLMILI